MLYVINNKCYINVAPSIYVEVNVNKNGSITPTNNKLEANATTIIQTTTVAEWLKRFVKNEPTHTEYAVGRKYNKRKK